jgi:hypothetical protein
MASVTASTDCQSIVFDQTTANTSTNDDGHEIRTIACGTLPTFSKGQSLRIIVDVRLQPS